MMLYHIHEIDNDGKPVENSVLDAWFSADTDGPTAHEQAVELYEGYLASGFTVRMMSLFK